MSRRAGALVPNPKKVTVKGKIPKYEYAGRPAQYEWDCTFCKRNLGTLGALEKHWKETHHTDKSHAFLPSKIIKKEKVYYCPACEPRSKATSKFTETKNR